MIAEPAATDTVLVPRPHRRRAVGLAALLGLALAAAAWWAWAAAAQAVPVAALRVAEARIGTLVRDAQVSGRAVAANSPTLYAPAAGNVALAVQAGDAVREGQVLARIDSPMLQAERDRESATLQQLLADQGLQHITADRQRLAAQRDADEARLALQSARREEERTRDACAAGVVRQVDCLRTQDAVQAATIRSAHAARNAALETDSAVFEQQSLAQRVLRQRGVVAEIDRRLAELQVRAPVAGRVGSIAVADRAAVDAATPLMTVVDLSQLEAELQVPESYVDDLGLGMRVQMRLGTLEAAGVLTAIAPEVLAGQVLVRVRFDAGQPPGLRQNQRLSARILIEERPDVLLLPRGPFVEQLGGHHVYVLAGDSALRRPVTLGALSVSAVEVSDGLAPGDRVVIAGSELFDNAPRVRVRD